MRIVASFTKNISDLISIGVEQGLTKLAELTVGDEKRAEGSETFQSLVAVLLRGLLVDRGPGKSSISAIDLLCLPNEILEKVALVLCEQKMLRLLDNIFKVRNQGSAFSRELAGRVGHRFRGEEAVQSDVNLLILQSRCQQLKDVESQANSRMGPCHFGRLRGVAVSKAQSTESNVTYR